LTGFFEALDVPIIPTLPSSENFPVPIEENSVKNSGEKSDQVDLKSEGIF
jgi:hypothetical protein